MNLEPGMLETDSVEVRSLRSDDLDWVVNIDRQYSDRTRSEYFKKKLTEVEQDTGIRISLAALVGGRPAGFLTGKLHYGEFGRPEPTALIDTIGVDTALAGQHVASALMRQLSMNLRALGVSSVQTQVDWEQADLIAFFRKEGFSLAPRLCLELLLDKER